ncbi:hypothetical protein EON64_03870, partial [archaeon]
MTKHLKSHENAHLRWNRSTNEKPFKCPREGCDKSFTAKSSLQNHMRCHYQEDGDGSIGVGMGEEDGFSPGYPALSSVQQRPRAQGGYVSSVSASLPSSYLNTTPTLSSHPSYPH